MNKVKKKLYQLRREKSVNYLLQIHLAVVHYSYEAVPKSFQFLPKCSLVM